MDVLVLGDGVPLLVVSRQLGRASPQITATIDAHPSSDELLEAVGQAFRAVAGSGVDRRGQATHGGKPFNQATSRSSGSVALYAAGQGFESPLLLFR
jgi:hypothetical protein